MGKAYDAPDFTIRREAAFETVAGAAGVSAKFARFQKIRLKAAHFIVTTAGTTGGHTAILKNGTTVLGTCTLGTNTAGYSASLTGLNAEIASLTPVTITNGTDAAGKEQVIYEYEVMPDTTESA